MAKGISDLGNGLGFVYVTEPDGTTVLMNIENTAEEVRDKIKVLALQAAAQYAPKIATGLISVNAISGVGNITAITISGVNQIAASISVTGKTEAEIAQEIAAAFNSYTPSGVQYTAGVMDTEVVIYATAEAGSSVNALAITVTSTDPVNIDITTEPMTGGAEQGAIIDEVNGYRFFLDADYGAGASSCSGDAVAVEGVLTNSIEITNAIVVQGLQGAMQQQDVTISADSIYIERMSMFQNIFVDTEASAATDDLATIAYENFSDGDVIIIRGTNAARVVTLKSTDNIQLFNGEDFETSDYSKSITLQYWNHPNDGPIFVELSRIDDNVTTIITTSDIQDAAVTTVKIADDAVTEDKIADGAVTADKIEDGAITASKLGDGEITIDKLDSASKLDLVSFNVSFETNEQGDYKIKFPYKCVVEEITAYVYKAIAATDDATIIAKNQAGGVMNDGVITLPAGLAIGSGVSAIPTSNNSFEIDEVLTLTTGKTTVGGKCVMSVKVAKSGEVTSGGSVSYSIPSFTAFTLVGYDELEVGDEIPAGAETFTWSTQNSGNITANSIDLIEVTGGPTTLDSGLANDGTEGYTFAVPITYAAIATHQFKIEGTNTQGGTFSRTYNVNWMFRMFYGNSASAGPLAEAAIEALGTNPLQSGYAGEYFFAGGDYKYLAFPDAWGTPTTFKDADTMLNVPMEVVYQVNLTNSFGVSEDYNIYRSTNILGGDVTIIVA